MTLCLSEPHFLHWQSFACEYMCVYRLTGACADAHVCTYIWYPEDSLGSCCYSDSVFLDVLGSIVGLDLTSQS